MTPYMNKVLVKFSEEITTTAPMQENENLFKVQDYKYTIPLSEWQAAQFHHVVVQILFASRRVHQDL